MKFPTTLPLILVLTLLCGLTLARAPAAGATASASPLPVAKPEEVGMSSARFERLHGFIADLIARKRIPGAVTAVARQGRLVHFEAQGMADIGNGRPMRTDDIFAIASMTKPIAAVATMMLLEEGRLRLYDPLEKFLPEFRDMKVAVADPSAPNGSVLVPAQRSITIHDLLTQRAGFVGPPVTQSPAAGFLRAMAQSLPAGASNAQYVSGLATVPLDVQPGTAWEYGAGFVVLSRVVEVASGQTFAQFLQQRLFEPLGMVDTGFVVPEEKRARIAPNHRFAADGITLERIEPRFGNAVTASGSSGLFSTAADYLRFCQMLLNNGELDGRRVLSRKSVELLRATHVASIPMPFLPEQGYGLGVAVQQPGGDAGLLGSPGTYGWSGAYNTYFRIDPQEQVIVLLMVQRSPPNDMELQYGFQNTAMQAIAD